MLGALAALVLPQVAFAQSEAVTLIHAGVLIDGTESRPQEDVTIRIQGNRIVGVESGFQRARGNETVIDLKNSTVMPGFIDMHTHLTSQLGPGSYMNRFTQNATDVALQSVQYAERTLNAGFTTVRDLGDSFAASIALRDAINRGIIEGPRIFTAGKSIATTGGHADPSNGFRDGLVDTPTPAEGVANGPLEARQAVRARYQEGSDLIKITATGGVLSLAASGDNPQFMMDELEAIVETARDYGMRVAVHAHGKEGMLRAIRAGVDSIEHGTYMDEEVFAAMREHGTWYVPTITAGKSVAERAEIEGFFPEQVRPKARAIGPLIQSTFGRAYEAGVRIAYGTDAGVFDHGENAREFQYMVEAGMPAIEAIRAATSSASQLLGQSENLGTIEEGKFADIVAVEGNPLSNIELLQNISFIMKNGEVYRQ
ncbi:amidohydrolase family protein [Aliidiomarina sp. B3213]|uniref:metal-dependent hydrolase family protein n=1 Tax=Aliidiomarina sp. B3213 TaxID=2249757 RepID=UPI000DD0BE40|nr:amidohydrolase family protein [Aliidiomarina sp. B3213]RTE86806.1 amidohydrolase family protein [Aliidiomarina sp. B3213]TCZ91028.1 amidohydrolase family protein [Lysobacter sp. N42]